MAALRATSLRGGGDPLRGAFGAYPRGVTWIRPLVLSDAARLSELQTADREILAMYDYDDEWFTPAGQRARLEGLAPRVRAGVTHPFAILDDAGDLAGTLFVNDVVRGRLQSAALGYWVGSSYTGRGLATRAVQAAVAHAFGPLGLHRVEAATLVDNHASQRVLEHNGFSRYGVAKRYLFIRGAWRDHILFQRTVEDQAPASSSAGSTPRATS
jgi:ribosomal-protein-alanine N-acetyltransferase